MARWTGYITCEPELVVVPYTSSHAERRSAEDSARRWAYEHGYTPTGGACYSTSSELGEGIAEELESLMTGECDGWELVDTLELEPMDRRGASWYAKEAGVSRGLMEALSAAVHLVHPNTEERDALEYAGRLLQRAAACSAYPVPTC